MTPILRSLPLVMLLGAGCAAVPAAGRAIPDAASSGDPLILVMAADTGIGRIDLRGARSGAYRQPRRYPGLPAHIARAMAGLAEENDLRPVDDWPMLSLGVQCLVFAAPPAADVDALLARLAADPRVESAQRMNRFEVQSSSEAPGPDDPFRSLQRSLDELDVAAAHRWSTGRGVRVAVVDTQVAAGHPELAGQVAEARDFVGGDAGGERHGTAVAGVIASRAGNRIGIVGVAPGTRLLALRACAQQPHAGKGSCTTFNLARAIDYAIGADADVINLSLGGPQDRLLERLLVRAMARGIVIVAAAGEGDAAFPSALDGVIAVGVEDAAQSAPAPAPVPALGAPGVDVLSLVPPDGYDYFSGSSIAAAQVSGVVALLLERVPRPSAPQIGALLVRTARHPARKADGARLEVDACAALAAVRANVRCVAAADGARAAEARPSTERLETD